MDFSQLLNLVLPVISYVVAYFVHRPKPAPKAQ